MAQVERWNTTFNPLGSATTYTIRIKEEGFVGSINNIDNLDVEGLIKRNRGSKDNSNDNIIGSEFEFSFYITDADGTEYDDLFSAYERQFQIEVEKAGSTYFIGWMLSDNVSKVFVEGKVAHLVTLSFVDGLASLKKQPFQDSSGNLYTTRLTFLEIIKNALTFTGIESDIKVQLGVWEASEMTSVQCALQKADINPQRFIDNQNSRLVPKDCYDVLTTVLSRFDCTLRQVDGDWQINARPERDSFIFTFDWATLTQQSRVAFDPTLDITTYDFTIRGNVLNLPPVRTLAIEFQNRFVAVPAITNGDFSSGTANWTNGTAPNDWSSGLSSVGDQLLVSESSLWSDDKEFISDSFTMTQVNDSDLISIQVFARITNYTESLPGPPQWPDLIIEVDGPTSTDQYNLGPMSETMKEHFPSVDIPMQGSGSYTVKLIVDAGPATFDTLGVAFDLVDVKENFGGAAVTTDQIISTINTDLTQERTDDILLKIGDSLFLADQGCIQISGTLTDLWNAASGSLSGYSLNQILGVEYLEQRQGYREYITVDVYDASDLIQSDSTIQIDSDYFRIIRYVKKHKTNLVSVDIVEIKSGVINWTTKVEQTDAEDGQGSGTSTAGAETIAWGNVINTPTTLAGYGITNAYTKTQSDALYAPISHTHSFSSLTGIPTTLAGYGITDAYTKTESDINFSAIGHTHTFGQLTVTPTTLFGYGISDQKADFNVACSDGAFIFVGDPPTAHTHALNDLSDVVEGSPVHRDVLAYNNPMGYYENRLLIEADISDLGSYTDATVNETITGLWRFARSAAASQFEWFRSGGKVWAMRADSASTYIRNDTDGINVLIFTNAGAASFISTVQGTQLKSTIAIGTAPLTVVSTTVVANLNADLLDGVEGLGYMKNASANTVTAGGITMNDNIELRFGTLGNESNISSDGTDTNWSVDNGDIYILSGATKKFWFDISTGDFHADGNITANSTSIP